MLSFRNICKRSLSLTSCTLLRRCPPPKDICRRPCDGSRPKKPKNAGRQCGTQEAPGPSRDQDAAMECVKKLQLRKETAMKCVKELEALQKQWEKVAKHKQPGCPVKPKLVVPRWVLIVAGGVSVVAMIGGGVYLAIINLPSTMGSFAVDVLGRFSVELGKSLEKSIEKSLEKSAEKALDKSLESVEKSVEKALDKSLESVEKSVQKTLDKSLESVEKSVEKTVDKSLESVKNSLEKDKKEKNEEKDEQMGKKKDER